MSSSSKLMPNQDCQKAAIYVRVSTQYQVDKDSLPVQRSELIAYSKYALGIDDYVVFEDPGYSAKNTDRPDYQRMMARVRTGEFSHVLVWKIDRISRNVLDFASMYEELKCLGVAFVSKTEQFDTSSAMGEAMLKIILVFAELERNITSERVTAIMLSRAATGVWNGGKVPYGYDFDSLSRMFYIAEEEARVVDYIYELYESLQSLTAVAKRLNSEGFRTRSGKPWNPVSVRIILSSPFYTGTYRYNYRDESKKGTSFKPSSEWIVVEDNHPAIISKERQAIVIEILHEHRRGNKGNKTYQRKHVHIFAGLLRCGCCGSSMSSTIDRQRSDGWRPSVYICTRRRRFDDCDNKYVTDRTLGPFVINFIANMIRASNSFGKSTSINTLERKLLRGPEFSSVSHIGRRGLEELYNHLRSGFDEVEYKSSRVKINAERGHNLNERDILMSERRRLERAMNRLQSLFLMGEDAIAEKDYLVERKHLSDQLCDANARLNEIDSRAASDITMSDEEFIEKASYFILTNQLLDKRHIDYERFIRDIDPKIVKDFLNSIVSNFCIKNGLTTSILFKNGIELQFFYNNAEDTEAPEA